MNLPLTEQGPCLDVDSLQNTRPLQVEVGRSRGSKWRSMTQAQVIAEIATTLSDKPIPTAVEILMALNKAFEAGLRYGLTFPVKPIEGFDDRA